MPVLTVCTNVAAAKVPADFKAKATDVLAKSLGKPASYIAIHILADQDISFGGTTEPAALCTLMSIGALGEELNKKHSKVIMDLLGKSLNIDPARSYITFQNENKANVGYDGTTFADLI